jgi:hypothetical protein
MAKGFVYLVVREQCVFAGSDEVVPQFASLSAQAALGCHRIAVSHPVIKARKSAASHATSNRRLCPAATRMALIASPVAPAK